MFAGSDRMQYFTFELFSIFAISLCSKMYLFSNEESNNSIVSAGYYIISGTMKKLHPEYSAMLVSDPLQCQEG